MNSVWSSLLWKEWREHRRLFNLLAMASALSALAPWLSHDARAFLWWPVLIVVGATPAASLFLGAGIASGERSNRTIGFLQALPRNMRMAAVAKLLVATGIALTPMAILAVVWWIWQQLDPGMLPDIPCGTALQQLFVGGLAALSLLLWMAAVGVNQSDEIRAGAVGLLVMMCIWAAIGLIGDALPLAWPNWLQIVAAAAPGGAVFAYSEAAHLLPISVVSYLVLVAWYLYRFGRVAPPRTPAAEPTATWQEQRAELRPPRSGPTQALLWKQFRETGPLGLLGAGCTLCVAAVIARVVGSGAHRGDFLLDALPLVAIAWVMVSYFVALIAGIGLFADDLTPRINVFWRSRPMAVTRWFSVKYASALAITLVALSLPMLLIAGGIVAAYGVETIQEAMPEQPLAMLGVEVAALAAAFTVAAAATAWFRQPVLAAVVAILVTVVAVWFADVYVSTNEQVFAALIVVTSLAALLAWQAVRRDLSLTAN